MFNGLISFAIKALISMVIWVFILSVRVDDRILFDYAHEFLVENPMVDTLDEQLSDTLDDLKKKLASRFSSPDDSKSY